MFERFTSTVQRPLRLIACCAIAFVLVMVHPSDFDGLEEKTAAVNTPIMFIWADQGGRFLNTAGIPTYGMSGMFAVPGENNAHGLNEKLRVRSLYEGRRFLEAIVRDYARQ